VSFSSDSVRKILNREFVCTTVNISGDENAGISLKHRPSDPPGPCLRGNGEHNVQILMLTPKGRILNVLAGYVDPAELAEELRFASKLWKDVAGMNPDDAEAAVERAHSKWLNQHAAKRKQHVPNFMGQDFAGMRLPADFRDQFTAMFDRGKTDHEFARSHPLLPIDDYRSEMLVGNAKTFFGSTSFLGGFDPMN
jgi:hypothetical protein